MLYRCTMIIACPACATRYAVPDSAIGVEGRTVRCAKCRHSWFQEPAAAADEDAGAAPEAGASQVQASPQEAAFAPAPPTAPEPSPAQTVPAAPAEAVSVKAAAGPASPSAPPAPASSPLASPVAAAEDADEDEGPSQFDFAPPFRPRRNWAKIGMIIAIVFAAATLGLAGAVAWAGLPDWVPVARPTFAEAQQDLVLDFPPKRQDRRTLPNGTEYFGASGTVSNVGARRRNVPTILIVLRDARERIVYSWEVVPPKRELAPGESITINEAVTDVPKTAKSAEIGWKPL